MPRLERTLVPIEQEVTWAPQPVWMCLENVKPLSFAGIRTLDHPVCSLVTTHTELL